MNEPIKAEFKFKEQPDSKLKIAYEHEVIPVDFDYTRHIHKGDCLSFLATPAQSSPKPEFWFGAQEAYQNILNENFSVVNRVFIVEQDHEGNNRNLLRIILERDAMRYV